MSVPSERPARGDVVEVGGAVMSAAADSLWAEDPQFPVVDWKYEVSNDDTRLGYFDWVDEQRMHPR